MRSVDIARFETQSRLSTPAARHHNGLPLTIGILRSMRTAEEDEVARAQDSADRRVMVELYAEKVAALGGNEGIEFCESIGVRLPSLFENC